MAMNIVRMPARPAVSPAFALFLLLTAMACSPVDYGPEARLHWPEVADCMVGVYEQANGRDGGPYEVTGLAVYQGELAAQCMARHAETRPSRLPAGDTDCYSTQWKLAQRYFDGYDYLAIGYAAAVCARFDVDSYYGRF